MELIKKEVFWIALSLPAIVYVVYRAMVLDFNYDECWTFLGYAQASIYDVLVNTYPAANNHVLHSLLMKLSAKLFGDAPFALRIPVVLAFFAYILVVIKMVLETPKLFRLPVFLGLIYQPYLLDYFSMARGYGIALAALLFAVFVLFRFTSSAKSIDLWKGSGALIIASWSNFAFLLPSVAWWGIAALIVFKLELPWQSFFKSFLSFIATALVLFTAPIMQLIEANELYYGANHFFTGTLQSVLARIVYQIDIGFLPTMGFSMLLLVLLLITIHSWLKSKKPDLAIIGFSILILSFVGNIIQRQLTGAPYLIDRTALFSIPLLFLAVPLLYNNLHPALSKVFNVALTALILMNMWQAFNGSYFLDFKPYADTENAMRKIKALTGDARAGEVVIGKSTYMNATINYYKEYLDMPQIAHSSLAYCNEQASYPFYYLFEHDLICVHEIKVDTLAYFEVSGTYLFRLNEEGPTK